jgi:signal transduction histidine kinase
MQLRLARRHAEGRPELTALLDAASAELQESLKELRELARGIHPAVLTDRGLRPALEALAARTPVPVHIEGDIPDALAAPIATAVYFVAAEALTNVAKYARATHATLTVAVRPDPDRIVLEVTDDGIGGARPSDGSGLRGPADVGASVVTAVVARSAPACARRRLRRSPAVRRAGGRTPSGRRSGRRRPSRS